ncbi:linear amide C-N hydrolase [Inquilinus limosus]|uniref:linear amide C-N hydrolase n=1 Tax=Inquilinus limosus TaxID=171674 RepID=UPI003F14A023
MCTDFLLLAKDASVVNGRSVEFGTDLKSEILVGGRGTLKQSPAPEGKEGYSWNAKYGYVGTSAYNRNIISDGMNERGLSIGALWLPTTRYKHDVPHNKAVVVELFASWVLGTCATVDEVKHRLHNHEIEVWGDLVLDEKSPLHFPIHDEAGRSIVVEFTNRETHVYDNPVGVVTNDPPFPWQITNIQNYVGLFNVDAEPIEIGLKRFAQAGHGSGMRGVPGDSTPPSRFIRTVFNKHFAEHAQRPKNSEEACNLALHLLNTVDIPKGTSASRTQDGGTPEYDYPQVVVVKALTEKIFNFRTYDNPTVMRIDLKKLNLSDPVETRYPLPTQPVSIDITPTVNRAAQ